jgi:hypothetical protein
LQTYLRYNVRLAFTPTAEGIESLNALSATPAFASRVNYLALSPPKTSLLRSEDVYAIESEYLVSGFEASRIQAAQQHINSLQHNLTNSGVVDNVIAAAPASMTTIGTVMDVATFPDEDTLHYARRVGIITGPHFDNNIARAVRTCTAVHHATCVEASFVHAHGLRHNVFYRKWEWE